MRISDFSTDKATDVICEITPYVANIVSDEELLEEIKKVVNPDVLENKAQMLLAMAEKVTKIVPILLKKRKEDVYGILGALNEKTPEEIAKQNFLVTMKQIKELTKDKELLDFFK